MNLPRKISCPDWKSLEFGRAVDFCKKYNCQITHINLYHIIRGRLSGFPDCCILFFIQFWHKITLRDNFRDFDIFRDYYDLICHAYKQEYIACPKCIVDQTFVECLEFKPWQMDWEWVGEYFSNIPN